MIAGYAVLNVQHLLDSCINVSMLDHILDTNSPTHVPDQITYHVTCDMSSCIVIVNRTLIGSIKTQV